MVFVYVQRIACISVIATEVVGLSQACLNTSLPFAKERIPFSRDTLYTPFSLPTGTVSEWAVPGYVVKSVFTSAYNFLRR